MIDSVMGSDLLSKRAQAVAVLFTAFATGGISPLIAVLLAVGLTYVLHR